MKQTDSLFEKFGKLLTIAGNAVMMNLMFLAGCLPIVTIGASWSGLFSAIRYNVRGEKWFEGYKVGFKTRFWRSVLSWLIMLIPILVVLEADVISALLDANGAFRAWSSFTTENIVRLVFACIMALLLTGLSGALTLLNVYIPTSVGNWASNAAKLVFKAPLQVALTGLLMWFPLLMVQLFPTYFYLSVMIFLVAYFVLAALFVTMLMKKSLLDTLLEARTEGTLLQEEGKQREPQEDPEEDA